MSATAPQSQSPDSSASSPGQNRSPRQHGLEPSSSEVYTGDNATTEGATEAVTAESGRSDADGEVSSNDWPADMRRVKLYELIESRWTDRGTALCTGVYDEEVDQAEIVVRSETSDVELVRREIRLNDVYQRQQETDIVWTAPDGTGYTISFQDVDGCAEVWDFIIEVQLHFRRQLEARPRRLDR